MLAVSRTSSLAQCRRLHLCAINLLELKSGAAVQNLSSLCRRRYQSSSRHLKASTEANVKEAPAMSPKDGFAKRNPFAFQLIVATAKTMAADLMTQVVAEGKSVDDIDWKRNGLFVIFGFAYLGGFQYWLMVNKFRQWFPTMDRFAKLSLLEKINDRAGMVDAVKMVVFDVLIHLPMIYFPCYYTVKEFVSGSSWNPVDLVKTSLSKYSQNFKDDFSAMIRLWGPSDCIQFILPVHIRLPFRHFVSFFWTAYVSFTRGAMESESSPQSVPLNAEPPSAV